MSQQTINRGTTANDGTGDPLRDAFGKVNSNFSELYSGFAGKNNYAASAAPTITDDTASDYAEGSLWLWPAQGILWQCVSAASGAAVWRELRDVYPLGLTLGNERREYFLALGRGISPLSSYIVEGSTYWEVYANNGTRTAVKTLGALRLTPSAAAATCEMNISSAIVKRVADFPEFGMKARVAFKSAGSDPTSNTGVFQGVGFQPRNGMRDPISFWRFDFLHDGTAVRFVARRRLNSGTIQSTILTYPGDGVVCTLEVIVTASSVKFVQDGTVVLTDTTTIPASTTDLREIVVCGKTSGADACAMDMSWISGYQIGNII